MDSGTFLAKRSVQYALPANRNKLLDILRDVWHPTDNPKGYLNLGVAENTLMHKELLQYISAKLLVDGPALGYGDSFSGSHRLKGILAAFLTRHFGAVRPIQAADLAVTSGVSAAIEACAFVLGDVGDGVLLARPFYKAFPYNLSNRAGLRPVFVSFFGEDPFGPESVVEYERALLEAREKGITVRALLLCNPHNPLGVCASRHTLIRYMGFCQKYGLHLISDEIYGLSCWENPETPKAPGFHSVMSIDHDGIINPALVHVIWGISKDLGMNGVRLGCVVSQNNQNLIRALQTNSIFTCPSSFADKITTMMLSDRSFINHFVTENQDRLRTRYAEAAAILKRNGISYRRSNAAFFLWADLFSFWSPRLGSSYSSREAITLEERLNQYLLSQKVFVTAGGSSGSEEAGWFRITFALGRDYVHEGLARVVLALKSFEVKEP
ncbi:aspartate aminotransferase [Colletotrichum musicola]|uniref:Aspartate aminotransferase n=1 Tax=Colletotrichum musicola TaxID=2175873 RepID=A0A8H6ISX2_9PEZI|nr:aspartate aminotransferase [Colletotrichum musicola]